MIAGIEAGGTKCVLAIGSAPDRISAIHTIATRSPEQTVAEAIDWFRSQPAAITALGLATFGPVGLDRDRADWGHILTTPKEGWSGFDFAGTLAAGLNIPVAVDTDVNAAALAEARVREGCTSLAYMTVGTGIGVGLVIEGRAVHGAAHPEMGHYYPRRPPEDDGFAGTCSFHGDCLEGLASGSAIMARWGAKLSDLPAGHPGHELVASYLAQACHTLFAATAAEVIVMGGGVLDTPGLRERVAEICSKLDADYLPGGPRHRVTAPALGNRSGITGALSLVS